jgi:hypothetical protein
MGSDGRPDEVKESGRQYWPPRSQAHRMVAMMETEYKERKA